MFVSMTLCLASARASCPAPSELSAFVASADRGGLITALTTCAELASERQQRMAGARILLAESTAAAEALADEAPPVPARRTRPRREEQAPPVPPRRRQQRQESVAPAAHDAKSMRRELSTWHESLEDRDLAQRKQSERARRNWRPAGGKPELLVRVAELHERKQVEAQPFVCRARRPPPPLRARRLRCRASRCSTASASALCRSARRRCRTRPCAAAASCATISSA